MKKIYLILILFLTSLLTACSNLSCSNHRKYNCDLCNSFYDSFVCDNHYDSNSDYKCDICSELLTVNNYNSTITITTLRLSHKTYMCESIGIIIATNREAFIQFTDNGNNIVLPDINTFDTLNEKFVDEYFISHWLIILITNNVYMGTISEFDIFSCLDTLYVEIHDLSHSGFCAEELVCHIIEFDRTTLDFSVINTINAYKV